MEPTIKEVAHAYDEAVFRKNNLGYDIDLSSLRRLERSCARRAWE